MEETRQMEAADQVASAIFLPSVILIATRRWTTLTAVPQQDEPFKNKMCKTWKSP